MANYNINAGYGMSLANTIAAIKKTTGKTFVVAKSAAAAAEILSSIYTPDTDGTVRFFATLQSAHDAATASRGDAIIVAEGHTESVIAAGGIALSKAGISYFFLGSGASRPTFTFSTSTSASILVSGASTKMVGFPIMITTLDGMLNPIDVTAAGFDGEIEWQDTSSAVGAVTAVRAVTVSNFKLNLIYKGFTAGSTLVRAVSLNGVTGARINIDAYGLASVAWVNMVTVLSTNVEVTGTFYTQGIADLSRNVVDTITGSKWGVQGFDASAGYAFAGGSGTAVTGGSLSSLTALLAVPSADVVTNTNERDVIGNKSDAAITAVGTTKSIAAYAKGLVTMNTVQSADSTNNAFAGDVIGNKTDASVYTPGTTKSIVAHVKGTVDMVEKGTTGTTRVMTNADTLFTIAGGPIQILGLVSLCITGNDGTASTLQYQAAPTTGSATTFSGASASLANKIAGDGVVLNATALATAPDVSSPLVALGPVSTRPIIVPAGTIKAVVGVGTTTGTWKHFLRWIPLAPGVTVVGS